ncbi:MAG: GNAT family N-acetyltransferase [Planctomycetota bacterium]
MTIRPFDATDTPRLIEILELVFGEYGMRFDPDGFDKDVRDVARRYAAPSGVFFTAEDDQRGILGFGGADLPRDGVAEIHRLYIDPAARGLRLGTLLVDQLEEWARARVPTMTLWSDVRFFHAHDLYARLGYRLCGQRRLGDPDKSTEFGFRRSLRDPRDDRPFVAELQFVPYASLAGSAEAAHEASMIAAAILDSRTLARGAERAHVLPDPRSLFPASAGELEAVFQRPEMLVGFRAAGTLEKRLHPLFSARLKSR